MPTRALILGAVTAAACAADGDAPAPDSGTLEARNQYVIDSITIPATTAEARANGFDLDGNGSVDNRLGSLMGAWIAQGLDIQGATTRSLDRGTVNVLVDLGASSFTDGDAARLAFYEGIPWSPAACDGPSDTVCRRHFDGHGSFAIATGSTSDPALAGVFQAGTLAAGPGHLPLWLPFTDEVRVRVTLIGARARATMLSPDAVGQLVLAGAMTQADIDNQLVPGFRDIFMGFVTRDCTALSSPPGCGCGLSTLGRTYVSLLDTSPSDCTITAEEVGNDTIIRSQLTPDVEVEGQRALSFGITATAVPATFTVP